jgi:hypothetical protein
VPTKRAEACFGKYLCDFVLKRRRGYTVYSQGISTGGICVAGRKTILFDFRGETARAADSIAIVTTPRIIAFSKVSGGLCMTNAISFIKAFINTRKKRRL